MSGAPIIDGWVSPFRLTRHDKIDDDANALFDGVAKFFKESDSRRWRTESVDDVVEAMDAVGVDGAVLSAQERPDAFGMPLSLDDALVAVRQNGERFRVAWIVDSIASAADVARRVHLGVPEGVAMVSITPSVLGIDIDDRRLYPLYEACAENGVPARVNVGISGPRIRSSHQNPMLLA